MAPAHPPAGPPCLRLKSSKRPRPCCPPDAHTRRSRRLCCWSWQTSTRLPFPLNRATTLPRSGHWPLRSRWRQHRPGYSSCGCSSSWSSSSRCSSRSSSTHGSRFGCAVAGAPRAAAWEQRRHGRRIGAAQHPAGQALFSQPHLSPPFYPIHTCVCRDHLFLFDSSNECNAWPEPSTGGLAFLRPPSSCLARGAYQTRVLPAPTSLVCSCGPPLGPQKAPGSLPRRPQHKPAALGPAPAAPPAVGGTAHQQRCQAAQAVTIIPASALSIWPEFVGSWQRIDGTRKPHPQPPPQPPSHLHGATPQPLPTSMGQRGSSSPLATSMGRGAMRGSE